jgi:mono/diheme cytochrome c family protein
MKVLKKIAVTVSTVAAIGAVAFAATRAQDAPRGDATTGKRLYLADGCFTCHGRSGQGGAYNTPAPILAHTAMPFDGFKGQIRNPINDMPAFPTAILSDKDIADIYAFVEALPGPRSPKDFPILNN